MNLVIIFSILIFTLHSSADEVDELGPDEYEPDPEDLTTRDTSEIWKEVFADSEPKKKWPRDKYGFSKQRPIKNKVNEKDKKFMEDVYKRKDKYHKYQKQNPKKVEAFEKRVNKTLNIIANEYKKDTNAAINIAKSIINEYKKEATLPFIEGEHILEDFISPLVEWYKNDTDKVSTDPNKRKNTLAIIQKTIDKHISDSKGLATKTKTRKISPKNVKETDSQNELDSNQDVETSTID